MKRHTGSALVAVWALLLLMACVAVPAMLVHRPTAGTAATTDDRAAVQDPLREDADEPAVSVYRSVTGRIESYGLETYVRGVVAAEMPADFPLEALKAQAIAARTYAVRRMKESLAPTGRHGAWFSDTAADQAFWSVDDMKAHWGTEFSANYGRVTEAVSATRGQILLYEGQPIVAAFFSTSNGYTENSEDYWKEPIPYLQAVPSPWDEKLSPKYKQETRMDTNAFYSKLGWQSPYPPSSALKGMDVRSRTAGRRIGTIVIAGRSFTGREVREKLGLASASFSWRLDGDQVLITTYGSGHGVGMSQWGADGLAREGKSAEEILRYYYQGVTIGSLRNIAKSF